MHILEVIIRLQIVQTLISRQRYYSDQIIVFNHAKQPWRAHVLILIKTLILTLILTLFLNLTLNPNSIKITASGTPTTTPHLTPLYLRGNSRPDNSSGAKFILKQLY